MRARLSVSGFAIVVGLWVSVPPTGGAVGAAQTGSTNVQTSLDLCQNGGWQFLTSVKGSPFKNQGQCISNFILNPVSLSDLAGSFSGTTTYFPGPNVGCSLISQNFDVASYPASPNVGYAGLQMFGCDTTAGTFGPFAYTGSFSLFTQVGELVGNASGPIYNVLPPPSTLPFDYELTLTVRSGTGPFAETTGSTIHVSILWPSADQLPYVPSGVTGSVTVP
jgi:hypothetical protein